METTYYYNSTVPTCYAPVYSSSQSSHGLGANCDLRMVPALAGGDGAFSGIRPIEASDSWGSGYPPWAGRGAPLETSKLQCSKTDPVGAWNGPVSGMRLLEGAPIGLLCLHILMAQAPLFIAQCGTPVVRSQVISAIKWLTYQQQTGLPAADFAGHSLFRGGVTSALMAGACILVIQALGRWRPESFRQYLEAPDCFLAQQMSPMAP